MSYSIWSNVDIDVETAKLTALTITGITKANPAVVTYTGTDPANGDFVYLDVAGMVELKGRVSKIAAVDVGANTFQLVGVDSTAFRTFESGTAAVVTFGASMTNVQDVNVSGGEPEFADITTVHDQIRRRIPTVTSPFTMQFGCLFDPTDAAVLELKEATETLSQRAVRVTFADGQVLAVSCYVSATGAPTGSAQDVVKTNVTFEGQGLPSVYA
jgi:hypothetical protein